MIVDNINSGNLYETINKRFKKAFDYLKNTDLLSLPGGKVEIDGKDMVYLISSN